MIATNITKKFSTTTNEMELAVRQNNAVSSIHQNHWKKTTDSLSTLSKHLVDPLSRWLIGCRQGQDDGMAWDRRTSQAHRATHPFPYPPIIRRYFWGVILFFFGGTEGPVRRTMPTILYYKEKFFGGYDFSFWGVPL